MDLKGVEEETRLLFGQKDRSNSSDRIGEIFFVLHTFEIRLKDDCCDG